DTLAREAVRHGASDLLITVGHPVMMTVAGQLLAVPGTPVLTTDDARTLIEGFLTPELREQFLHDLELDTRFTLPGTANFRVNLFMQRGHWGAAVRIVPVRVPLPAEIGLAPHMVERVLGLRNGLVLVTGPTGAGKSTTIASLLEEVN